MAKLDEVLLATFYIKNDRLILLSDEKSLPEGEKIWRKLPGSLVVPNFYYSADFYLETFKKCGLEVTKVNLSHFAAEDERIAYNQRVSCFARLGEAFVKHAPIAVFHVKNPQKSSNTKYQK